MKKSVVYHILAQYWDHGRLQPALRRQGRPSLLNDTDTHYLSALIDLQPCIYLDKIQAELERCCRVRVSVQALVRALRKLDLSWKTVSV
ncbi:hypothetical protein F5877DRAFT_50730 [Lentinula edodes]|nr:hypothetical protein F5877DRAFT_50730 [Lentinula edodes]